MQVPLVDPVRVWNPVRFREYLLYIVRDSDEWRCERRLALARLPRARQLVRRVFVPVRLRDPHPNGQPAATRLLHSVHFLFALLFAPLAIARAHTSLASTATYIGIYLPHSPTHSASVAWISISNSPSSRPCN